MRLTREVKFGAWLLAAVLIAAGAYLIGGSLKPEAAPHYVFQTDAPAYDGPASIAATSQGGFTGFGEVDGSGSHTVIAGKVVEKTDKSLVLVAPGGQRTPLSFAQSPNISKLEASSLSALKPGVTVAVRLGDDAGVAEAVLILSTP